VADRPLLAVAVVGLLLGGLVTGCSGTGSYCSALKKDQKPLASLARRSAQSGEKGSTALADTVDLLSSLSDEAPDDVADQWDTLVTALRGLQRAIAASGAAPADFAGGKRPASVTGGQYAAVKQAAAELQATPVQQAGTSIEQHAQDVCKVDLGESGLGGVG
jgi:hypothetical protein